MINNVVLTGRLTKDVDLRYTGTGTAVGSFTLAVDRRFKGQNGEKETDFINCVMWRKAAENFANFTHKGSLVGIEGRIQTRNYDNQQGQKVYVTEVIAENFTLLEYKNANNEPQANYDGTANNQSQTSRSSHMPNDKQQKQANYDSYGTNLDISDDDLPF